MGEMMKFAKAWALVAILSRLAFALSVVLMVVFIAVGDGGRFSIEWAPGAPGVQHE